jgi:serine/threonine protein kinase
LVVCWGVQGDLFQFLHRDEWAPQRKMVHKRWNVLMLKIAKDIAKGCAFLHSANPPVIHRDLKSPNVLVRCSQLQPFSPPPNIATSSGHVTHPTHVTPRVRATQLMDISKRASVVAKVADFGTCQQMAGIVAGRKVENPGAHAPFLL